MTLFNQQPRQMASTRQLEYIDILTHELHLTTNSRNVHFYGVTRRKIEYLSELTAQEASKVIEEFKKYRNIESRKQR